VVVLLWLIKKMSQMERVDPLHLFFWEKDLKEERRGKMIGRNRQKERKKARSTFFKPYFIKTSSSKIF
jgi:hypothetical protein